MSGEPLSLLVIATLSVTLPELVGLNTTFNVAVDCAFRVKGAVIPLVDIPDPVTVIPLI